MSYLLVSNEPTVELTGHIDVSGQLQLSHPDGDLSNHSNALQAEDPGRNIRIKLNDFTVGSSTWTVNASHDGAVAPIPWNRGTDHAYYDFPVYMSNFLEVNVTANEGATAKEKVIDIKTKPEGSLPDEL